MTEVTSRCWEIRPQAILRRFVNARWKKPQVWQLPEQNGWMPQKLLGGNQKMMPLDGCWRSGYAQVAQEWPAQSISASPQPFRSPTKPLQIMTALRLLHGSFEAVNRSSIGAQVYCASQFMLCDCPGRIRWGIKNPSCMLHALWSSKIVRNSPG